MGKRVLITGAGSGFGRGAALALAARGHDVVASTQTAEQAATLRAEAPDLEVVVLDVTRAEDVERVRDAGADVLINNAGVGLSGPLADVSLDVVRHLFEVNVFGTLAVTQAALPAMVAKGAGRVIIVSSIAGVLPGPIFGPYAMTKHALEAMGKTLRAEMSAQGIDVTLLNPGPYQTGFNDRMAASMWEWFSEESVSAPSRGLFEFMRDLVVNNQLDPREVVDEMVRLVEAETTEENNFVPPSIRDDLAGAAASG